MQFSSIELSLQTSFPPDASLIFWAQHLQCGMPSVNIVLVSEEIFINLSFRRKLVDVIFFQTWILRPGFMYKLTRSRSKKHPETSGRTYLRFTVGMILFEKCGNPYFFNLFKTAS